jgi:hypothetical protein
MNIVQIGKSFHPKGQSDSPLEGGRGVCTSPHIPLDPPSKGEFYTSMHFTDYEKLPVLQFQPLIATFNCRL